MNICADCISRYYGGSMSDRRGIYLCDYCNLYRDVYLPRAGARKKRRLPLKREDRLKRMFVWAPVTQVSLNGDDGDFSGPIDAVIARIEKFKYETNLAGYTFLRFEQEGDYDGSWYVAYGVRAETDGEMNKRFKRIRNRRERAKEKRLRKEIEKKVREAANVKA